MNYQTFPLDHVDENPWQTRTYADPQHVQAIADSIKDNRANQIGEHGLLQVPLGRMVGDRVQLAFGMTRRAAWQIANPDLPFPVIIQSLSDRRMSDLAAEENAKRKNLSAIETAQAIQRRMKDFGLTQMEAAQPFGYASQGSVSNLLRLLQLPSTVQAMVQENKLAERNARALVVLTRIAPAETETVALKSISTDNPESAIADAIDQLLWKTGRHLSYAAFKPSWPNKPIVLGTLIDEPGAEGIAELPACVGCDFNVKRGGPSDGICARPACYDAKQKIAVDNQLPAISKKLGIPLAADGEKTELLWNGNGVGNISNWEAKPKIERAIKAHLPELRLVMCAPDDSGRYDREQVLGLTCVALATTDKKKTLEYLKSNAKQRNELVKTERVDQGETEAQKKKRLAQEREDELERRAERASFNKEKHDVLWLLAHVAPIVADQLAITSPVFLGFVADEITKGKYVNGNYFGEINSHTEELERQIESARAKDKSRLVLERIVYVVLGHEIAGDYSAKPESVYHFGDVCENVAEICTGKSADLDDDRFGVKLPANWDKPPIHRTAYNCWHCGVFAPGEKLTKRDVEEFGWVNLFVDDEADHGEGVFCCQEHQVAYAKANQKQAPASKKTSKHK